MHIHQSIVEAALRRNIFTDPKTMANRPFSFPHYIWRACSIAWLIWTLLMAPHINSYQPLFAIPSPSPNNLAGPTGTIGQRRLPAFRPAARWTGRVENRAAWR